MWQEIILNCDDYYKSLLVDIEQAERSIDIETYIYNNDDFGIAVADALCRAVSRNVKVRVLVDGAGTPSWSPVLEKMERAGVNIRIFHPFPWQFYQWARANLTASVLTKVFHLISHINSRNHRKTCIIDQDTVYVGSVNIFQKHLGKHFAGEEWQDTVIKVSPVDAKDLQFAFEIAWSGFPIDKRIKTALQKIDGDPLFRLNFSRHHRRMLYKSLLRRLDQAKHRIWLMTAYFNPDYVLLKSIKTAARKKIDVKIILPHKSDVHIMPMIATTFYANLLEAGVEIYEYLPNILHSKILIIDHWYSLGSSNLNHRSLRHDLEVDVNVRKLESKEVLENQFLSSIEQSLKISLLDIKKQPLHRKMYGRMLLYARYFL